MRIIHWTPKENKESILERGIRVQDTWISFNFLTPFHSLNRWWLDFSNEKQEECIGVIIELDESDFPAYFYHWGGTHDQKFNDNGDLILNKKKSLDQFRQDGTLFESLADLWTGYKETILWRIGERLANLETSSADYIPLALKALKGDQTLFDKYVNDEEFMTFTFEDYELLLFTDIDSSRILSIVTEDEVIKYDELLKEIKSDLQQRV
ncbi:hypothetical protein [Aureibacter tunicatorum]|uniref:Uncharacterized protein n=1 Tax=Aureibacter tunicatorum TaxID=866807 RepID=A0AAE4BRL3_9BACT|nr:hypothetical protein [Aureibacter tunicatorum]MDR6238796.1 hypothetical protein [Aureibacter tunicatorum]